MIYGSAMRVVVLLATSSLSSASAVAPESVPSFSGRLYAAAERLSLQTVFDELASARVSGEELAAKAQMLGAGWERFRACRQKMAQSLLRLAAAFESRHRFSQALALYEQLWLQFPEQQTLIGKIKRDRALSIMPVDLSTPNSTFVSLKEALMVYELTAPTFGVVDPMTVLHEREPTDRHEPEAPLEAFETGRDASIREKWLGPILDPWHRLTARLISGRCVSLELKDTTMLQAVEKLAEASTVPIIVTPAASAELAKISNRERKDRRFLSLNLQRVPIRKALEQILDARSPKLRWSEGHFACRVYHVDRDRPEPLLTVVIQHEPGVTFPDEMKPGSDDVSAGYTKWLLQVLGLEDKPREWFLYADRGAGMEVVTAPASVLETVLNTIRVPESGRYYGRILPLFRCLRAYPLPGPPADRYGDARRRHIWEVQLAWQKRRMQIFLSDRPAIVTLLDSRLVGLKRGADNRFIPLLDLGQHPVSLTSRLGLWYDGKAYRFLLFDSRADRERWLKGEDWFDIPSDLNGYQ